MAEPARHPSARNLTAFGVGTLPAKQATHIARHLADCPECRRALEQSVPDSTRPLPRGPVVVPGVPPELSTSGKFEVISKIGEGGMGSVWKAKHAYLDCLVAIKVMSPDAAGHPDSADRFLREMRAAGRLQHPHIVRAFDAEKAGNLLLLVLEYVEGVTLERLVEKKGKVPVHYACRWVMEAAEGLQHAHEMGLVHRDIKPANLMLTSNSKEVKILDFGLARLSRDQAAGDNQTRHQTFMGTPEYVAPEQANDARSADIRADIYSLGCTLYFLLTGDPPFSGSTVMETLVAHLQDKPKPVSKLRPEVPPELAAVVAKMLAKSPKDRQQTPAEVAASLKPFAFGKGKEEPAADVIHDVEVVEAESSTKARPKSKPPAQTRVPSATRIATPLPRRRAVVRQMDEPGTSRARAWAAVLLAAFVAMPIAIWVALLLLAPRDKSAEAGDLKKGAGTKAAAAPPVGPGERQKDLPLDEKHTIGMEFKLIRRGAFFMGSPDNEEDRGVDEGPQLEVEITKAFYMGVYEVTQEQFAKVIGGHPSAYCAGGANGKDVQGMDTRLFPVESVTWFEAERFCKLLTDLFPKEKQQGRVYRLPTEAEWEYACRAGGPAVQPFHFGDKLIRREANFDWWFPYNSNETEQRLNRPRRVGELYKRNAFGLYDIHGNVAEWCSDWYDSGYYAERPRVDPPGPAAGTSRVIRGGSHADLGSHCRSAYRGGRAEPTRQQSNVGFRVVMEAPGG